MVENPVRAAWKWAVILEWANPVKFPRSLPESVSSGVPRAVLFLGLIRIVDKVILSYAVWPASTQMASSLSRTPPLLVRSFPDEMTRYRCPFWLAGAAHGYRYGRGCGGVPPHFPVTARCHTSVEMANIGLLEENGVCGGKGRKSRRCARHRPNSHVLRVRLFVWLTVAVPFTPLRSLSKLAGAFLLIVAAVVGVSMGILSGPYISDCTSCLMNSRTCTKLRAVSRFLAALAFVRILSTFGLQSALLEKR